MITKEKNNIIFSEKYIVLCIPHHHLRKYLSKEWKEISANNSKARLIFEIMKIAYANK
jgi:hypothetical protein